MNIKKIAQGITYDDVLLMPQKNIIQSRSQVNLKTKLTSKISLDIPIISANMDTVTEAKMAIAIAKLGGIGIIHRFLTVSDQVMEIKKVKKHGLPVGGAIGIGNDFRKRTKELLKAKADVIVIDIAHGHSSFLISKLKELKAMFPQTEFIAGNIATQTGAADLIKAGASALKVGIGPGSLCSTRIVAGSGVPQITAIIEVSKIAHKHKIPIIADGGIRYSGDIAKALAAGASTVMLGSLLAGCSESPALMLKEGDKIFKITRGMASLAANQDRAVKDPFVKKDLKTYAAEGVEGKIPFRGPIKPFLEKILAGVKSGFTYSGSKTIKEIRQKAEFIQITSNGLIESHPHDVLKI